MIELEPHIAIMLYLAVTMGSVLSLWFVRHMKQRNKKLVISEQKLIVCEYCRSAYMEQISKKVTKCPECLSYNKRY